MLEIGGLRRCGNRGFTLVEVMVTVAILAIILTVAVPNFVSFKRNSELTAASNSFVAILNAARSEAMKRSVATVVLPIDGSNWSGGWIAFVDSNYNGIYEPASDTLITQSRDPLPSYLSATKNGTNFFKYNGSGFSLTSAGLAVTTITFARNDLTGEELLSQTRRIKISGTGRVRICTPKPNKEKDCDANSDE